MPGNFPKISISKPESSAKQIDLDFFEKYLALIKEFSKNVDPFSFGLFKFSCFGVLT